MHDFKAKMKAVSRRIAHLRSRLEDQSVSPSSAHYDKAEVAALTDLMRVATLYNDARDPNGSHVENAIRMAKDVIDDTLTVNDVSLDAYSKERLQIAWEKLSESLQVVRTLAADDAKKDP